MAAATNNRRKDESEHPAGRIHVSWQDNNIPSFAADMCNVVCTREEIMLFFGAIEPDRPEQDVVPVSLQNRIIMSPFIAKKFSAALGRAMDQFEAVNGEIVVGSQPPVAEGVTAPLDKCLLFSDSKEAAEKAKLLCGLIEELNLEYGFERSFKMSEKKLLANRFLLGIHKKNIRHRAHKRIIDVCKQMDMPEDFLKTFELDLPQINIIHFGFEESERSCTYKVYSEFKPEVDAKPNEPGMALLYRGYKWDAQDNARKTMSNYNGYPLLPVADLQKRLADIYDGHRDGDSLEIVTGIINHAASDGNDSFLYVEVSEENNPRRSFDINFYKTRLRLKGIQRFLSEMRRHYSIPDRDWDRLYSRINTESFGHLSGGIGRDGKDFLTVYYGVEGY